MPKGLREGLKSRVKNKSRKKPCFKGKRSSEICKDAHVENENRVPIRGSITESVDSSLPNPSESHQVMENEDMLKETEIKSTSARKLEHGNETPTPLPQTPEGQGRSKRHPPTNLPEEEGYRVVYVENIRKAMESMHKCKKGNIKVVEDTSKRAGLSSTFYFECTVCKHRVDMDTSMKVEGKARSFDVNRRTNFAMGELGLGREALATICEILNMPQPISDSAYQKHNKSVNLATRRVLEEKLSESGHRLRKFLHNDDETETLDIAVSFDGTWSKRGFTANYGVGFVISSDTGEVLDFVVLSKVCQLCKAAEKQNNDPVKHQLWKNAHAASGLCQKNYDGSSPSMEKEAARILWSRSIEKHKFQYIDMVCDGDSKSCGEVWDIYGVCKDCKKYENMDKQSKEYQKWQTSKAYARWESSHGSRDANCNRVNKLDCVGHVQKRMGKNLIGLTGKTKLSDGKSVGGKAGRLTRPMIDKLQKYYGNAIRRCVDKKAKSKREIDNAVKKMQIAIKAVLYHSVKLPDEKKRHQYCDNGESSWCAYQRGKAVGTAAFVNKPHHLDPVFLEFLTPLFDRLSDKKLLKRCLPGLSQNANESVNALVWNRCPKHRNRGFRSVETAAASATMQFNIGAAGRHDVVKELGISGGCYMKAGSERKNKKRVTQANRRATKKFKEARQKIRQAKLAEEERLKAREGVTYQSGAFNEDSLGGSRKKKRKTGETSDCPRKTKHTRKK